MDYRKSKMIVIALCVWFAMITAAIGQDDEYAKVEIKTIKVADGIHMLMGKGGNIGVSTGEDGVFLIDDQFAPLTDKIKAAIEKISDGPVKFVFNTHYHFDHVGGNENLGAAGAVIVAHENVRKRLSTDQFIKFFQASIPSTDKKGLPVITFTQDLSFHLNEETMAVFHIQNAHTDGDAAVFFKKANVIHTGDIYFAGIYPFIDTESHGPCPGIILVSSSIIARMRLTALIIPSTDP